jgi:protein transport protein SEC24
LAAACASLAKILFGGAGDNGVPLEPCFPAGRQIAIVSYDRTLHFYNLSVCFFW